MFNKEWSVRQGMYLKQFFVEGLGHSSYLIASDRTGEAAVVDPRRDIEEYDQELRRQGLTLRLVLETHVHNDYVSGARQLAERFGATHVAPAEAGFAYPYQPVRQNDTLELGELVFRVLETPGHTPEHVAYVLTDTARAGQPVSVFTGGSLLVGSVGRVDLLGAEMSETLARSLYHSVVERILQLPDYVEVLPTHGAGSFCGKGIGRRRTSTVGYEHRFNHRFRLTEDEFVREVTSRNPGIPAYYRRARLANVEGAAPWRLPLPRALSPADVANLVELRAVVLDARSSLAFGAGHIPGSINVELTSTFATWSGWLVPFDRPIVLVLEDDDDWAEAVTALARWAG